jgi:hypothetical protein
MVFNLRYSEPVESVQAPLICHYFPDNQWLTVRDADNDVYFAARGGHNDESHNHIDLGHFVYGALQGLSLTDLGAGEYTKDYFADKRYDYFVTNAHAHAVPVINGQLQEAGAYQAEVLAYQKTDDTVSFSLALAQAYPLNPELVSFTRTFVYQLQTGELELTDRFKFTQADNELIENFVTQLPSEVVSEQTVVIGEDVQITSQSPKSDTQIIAQDYANHVGEMTRAYQIQDHYDSKSADFEIKYHIKKESKKKYDR